MARKLLRVTALANMDLNCGQSKTSGSPRWLVAHCVSCLPPGCCSTWCSSCMHPILGNCTAAYVGSTIWKPAQPQRCKAFAKTMMWWSGNVLVWSCFGNIYGWAWTIFSQKPSPHIHAKARVLLFLSLTGAFPSENIWHQHLVGSLHISNSQPGKPSLLIPFTDLNRIKKDRKHPMSHSPVDFAQGSVELAEPIGPTCGRLARDSGGPNGAVFHASSSRPAVVPTSGNAFLQCQNLSQRSVGGFQFAALVGGRCSCKAEIWQVTCWKLMMLTCKFISNVAIIDLEAGPSLCQVAVIWLSISSSKDPAHSKACSSSAPRKSLSCFWT